jgi:hypothetical protein
MITAGYWLDRKTYEHLRLCLMVDEVLNWPHDKGLSFDLLETATPTYFKVQSDEDATNQSLD